MAAKIPTSSIARPYKIYPNWDFCFENIPSGNTAFNDSELWSALHGLIFLFFRILFAIYDCRNSNNVSIGN
jgi:hypothetical protein